jgi:Spy/CpxP family protein refolding chaperone
MTTFHKFKNTRLRVAAITSGALLLITGLPSAHAQTQDPHAQHTSAQASDNQALADQIQALRQQVSNLQAAIQKPSGQRRANAGATQKGGMSMGQPGGAMGEMGEMGGMGSGNMPMDDKGEMSSMQSSASNMGMAQAKENMSMGMDMMQKGMSMAMDQMHQGMSMEDMDKMSGMGAMGRTNAMPGMAGMTAESALPGHPGASHLYHIGATGFFLDHPQQITLTTEQRTRLNQIKQRALLDRASAQRRIDEAEQQLFALTGADQPDQAKIEAQIKTIENLRAEERLAYIRAVGEATNVLTDQQRQAVVGKMTASAK